MSTPRGELEIAKVATSLDEFRRQPAPTEQKEWSSYSDIDPTQEKISDWVTILRLDAEWELYSTENSWAGVHSWRILTKKKIHEALPDLIERLIWSHEEDEWALEELPSAISSFGALAIPHLRKAIFENTIFREYVWSFVALIETLGLIAKELPQETANITLILAEKLREMETNSPTLNAFLIFELVDLKAVEHALLLVEAFSKDLVHGEIINWEYTYEKLSPLTDLPKEITSWDTLPDQLSYPGDESFQKLLKTLGSHFNVDEIKLFLLGAILSIELPPSSAVMDEVLTDYEGESVDVETQGQALFFARALLGLWNELSPFQDCFYPFPEVDNLNDSVPSEEDTKTWVRSARRAMQIASFLDGLELGDTNSTSFQSSEKIAADFLITLQDKMNELRRVQFASEGEPDSVGVIWEEIEEFWKENYLQFATTCKEVRKKKLDRQQFLETHRRVGRNDRCPCGSGKKFKKCCLNEVATK